MSDMHLTMNADGCLVIPQDMCRGLGMTDGGVLIARLESGCIVLEPFELALARIRGELRHYISGDGDVVSELIAERRAEAAGE